MRKDMLEEFSTKKILVIGDYMIDKYVYGNTLRISPEAPVAVVKVTSEKNLLGGAGNVVNNLSALMAKVSALGIVGNDKEGKILKGLLKEIDAQDFLFEDKHRVTTVKERVISGNNYQLLRLDYEDNHEISPEIQKKIASAIAKEVNYVDAIVISDYDKGLLTEVLARQLISLAKFKRIPVIVDTKPSKVSYYKNCTLITPNLKEAIEMTGIKEDIQKIGIRLVAMLNCNVFITRGPEGISVFDIKGNHSLIAPNKISKLFDVTGAGDTVVAVATLALLTRASLIQAAGLANYAAGIVVQKPGTSTVSPKELKNAMHHEISGYLMEGIEVKQKIIEDQLEKIEKAAHLLIDAYSKGRKVIAFGNGGSASDAQHLVGELVGRFRSERKALSAIALTTDTSVVTAIANDYGYDHVFERQIEAHSHPGDVVVGISTSGNSESVINAIRKAKQIGCRTIGLLGKGGGKLAGVCDVEIIVPSANTPRIQEAHIAIIHILCEILDKEITKSKGK